VAAETMTAIQSTGRLSNQSPIQSPPTAAASDKNSKGKLGAGSNQPIKAVVIGTEMAKGKDR